MTATTARQNQTLASFAGTFGNGTASSFQPQATEAGLSASETRRATTKGETTGTPRSSFISALLRSLSALAV